MMLFAYSLGSFAAFDFELNFQCRKVNPHEFFTCFMFPWDYQLLLFIVRVDCN